MLEKDGCESEFIVGHFENRICMFAHRVKFWIRFGVNNFCQIYPLILTLQRVYMDKFEIEMFRKTIGCSFF